MLQQAIDNNSTHINSTILEAPGWHFAVCNKLHVYQPAKQSFAQCSQPFFYWNLAQMSSIYNLQMPAMKSNTSTTHIAFLSLQSKVGQDKLNRKITLKCHIHLKSHLKASAISKGISTLVITVIGKAVRIKWWIQTIKPSNVHWQRLALDIA